MRWTLLRSMRTPGENARGSRFSWRRASLAYSQPATRVVARSKGAPPRWERVLWRWRWSISTWPIPACREPEDSVPFIAPYLLSRRPAGWAWASLSGASISSLAPGYPVAVRAQICLLSPYTAARVTRTRPYRHRSSGSPQPRQEGHGAHRCELGPPSRKRSDRSEDCSASLVARTKTDPMMHRATEERAHRE